MLWYSSGAHYQAAVFSDICTLFTEREGPYPLGGGEQCGLGEGEGEGGDIRGAPGSHLQLSSGMRKCGRGK